VAQLRSSHDVPTDAGHDFVVFPTRYTPYIPVEFPAQLPYQEDYNLSHEL